MYSVRPALVAHARSAAVLAVVSGAVAIAGLDWRAADVAIGASVGAPFWGIAYSLGIRELVPRDRLLAAPQHADVDLDDRLDAWPRTLLRTLWVLPLCAAATWLADRWDLGAVFAPGQFVGIAAAYLVAVRLVRRWEREHRQRAVFRENYADAELYAAPPGTRC